MMIRWLCWFSCVRSLDSARCSTFYLSYLMIRPPVTFSSMSHRVMKIPLTPFSWLDAPDTGYWYKTSSCRHRQQRRLALKQTLLLKSRTLHRGENKLVSFSIAECEISELGCYQMLSAINYGEKKKKEWMSHNSTMSLWLQKATKICHFKDQCFQTHFKYLTFLSWRTHRNLIAIRSQGHSGTRLMFS